MMLPTTRLWALAFIVVVLVFVLDALNKR